MKRKDALWVMQMCRDRDARSEAEREAFDTAIDALKSESIFTADRPKGEWVMHGEPPWYVRECSECRTKWHHWSGDSNPNYCGHCGADMRSTERSK